MINSTFGVKLPEDGDQGAPVFDALIHDLEYLRDHKHDGASGSPIAATDLARDTINLAAADWVIVPDRGYKQTITCPGSVTLANCVLRFRIRSGARQHTHVFPTVVPLTITQFEVITWDNTLDLEVLFT